MVESKKPAESKAKQHELQVAFAVFAGLALAVVLMVALNRTGAGNEPLPGSKTTGSGAGNSSASLPFLNTTTAGSASFSPTPTSSGAS